MHLTKELTGVRFVIFWSLDNGTVKKKSQDDEENRKETNQSKKRHHKCRSTKIGSEQTDKITNSKNPSTRENLDWKKVLTQKAKTKKQIGKKKNRLLHETYSNKMKQTCFVDQRNPQKNTEKWKDIFAKKPIGKQHEMFFSQVRRAGKRRKRRNKNKKHNNQRNQAR